MTLGLQCIPRRDLTHVCGSDALHPMELDKSRFSAGAAVRRNLKRADILHPVTDVNRKALAFHPAYIAGFFVERRNIHDRISGTNPGEIPGHVRERQYEAEAAGFTFSAQR